MTVIYQSGYTLPDGGVLLQEDGGNLLIENGFNILLDAPPGLTYARIAHSELWLSGGTASASTTDSDYFENGPLNSLTYEKWKPTAYPATWEYDHGANAEANCFCIAAHTLGTSGARIKAQYHNGSAWVDLCPITTITSDAPIMILFDDLNVSRFRLYIGYWASVPVVGVIKASRQLRMQREIYGGHAPADLARQTVLRSNFSETGEFLGRSKQRTYQRTTFSWSYLSAGWIRRNWPSLQRGIESEPFWIAWRPETFDAVSFMQADQSPIPQNMGAVDLMSVDLTARGLGYD